MRKITPVQTHLWKSEALTDSLRCPGCSGLTDHTLSAAVLGDRGEEEGPVWTGTGSSAVHFGCEKEKMQNSGISVILHTALEEKTKQANSCDVNTHTMAPTITSVFNNRLTEITENSILDHRRWKELAPAHWVGQN